MTRISRFLPAFLWVVPAYGQATDTAQTKPTAENVQTEAAPAEERRPSWRTQLLTWCDGDCMTGRWGGVRDELEEKGITFSLEYVSTLFANTHGGVNTHGAVEYTGNTHLTMSLDTGSLGWWEGGEVFIYAEERHGPGLTERHVGDLFTFNNDEERDFFQVSEYWWHQKLFDDVTDHLKTSQ